MISVVGKSRARRMGTSTGSPYTRQLWEEDIWVKTWRRREEIGRHLHEESSRKREQQLQRLYDDGVLQYDCKGVSQKCDQRGRNTIGRSLVRSLVYTESNSVQLDKWEVSVLCLNSFYGVHGPIQCQWAWLTTKTHNISFSISGTL